jgi:hypothetical protein
MTDNFEHDDDTLKEFAAILEKVGPSWLEKIKDTLKVGSPSSQMGEGLGDFLREHVKELKAELATERTEKLRALSLMTPEQLTLLRSAESAPSEKGGPGLTSKSAPLPNGSEENQNLLPAAPVPKKRSWL